MSDLGITMAWAALQVTLVLVPAAALHMLASRRSAASGSWMAVVGLGLSVAVSVAALVPLPRMTRTGPAADLTDVAAQRERVASLRVAGRDDTGSAGEPGGYAGVLSLSFARFEGLLRRLEHEASGPAARLKRAGSALAIAGMAGAGVGLVRLCLGLWAVRLCRRRGTIVDDPKLLEQVDEIKVAMGCRSGVEIREIPELTTPATAGWRQPVILLPHDWRAWRDADRRAVLAHELAHIQRSDYAAGLLARLALACAGLGSLLIRLMIFSPF